MVQPFTGYSYATGLAALGQGLNRISEGYDREEERRLLANLGMNMTPENAARAGKPELAFKLREMDVDKKRSQDALRLFQGASLPTSGGVGATSGGGASLASAGGEAPGTGLLRKFEGFRETPYWDVNALRTGYGSDTITKADGTVERVGQGTRVTREDSERDLQRRLNSEFIPRAQQAIGGAWEGLSSNAKDALASVTYNYGRLPDSVATAARTGDPQAIAGAIAGLAGHNGGVNAGRRRQEAAYVLAGSASQPYQVASAGSSVPAPGGDPAAVDAARVQREGGPRMVLSGQSPLMPPGGAPQPGAADPATIDFTNGTMTPSGVQSPPDQAAGLNYTDGQFTTAGAQPDGRVRLAQAGTSDSPLPISPGQFLVQRQQQRDGQGPQPAVAPSTFRPPAASPELEAIRQRAERAQQAAQVAPPAERAMWMQTANQLATEYRQARTEQVKAARDEWADQQRQSRERVRPVTDPQERAALGFRPDDGPLFIDGNGRPILPTKSGTSVNIDQKSEGEFSKEAGKGIAKRFLAISEEGDAGRSDLSSIGQIRALGGAIDNSTLPAVRAKLAEYGVKIGDDVPALEAFNSLVDKLTPQQRVPGAGATSDFDAKMFKASLPSLMRTPDGNNLIMGTLEALAQDKIARAEIAERALSGELKPGEAVKELRALQSPNIGFKSGLEELKKSGRLGASAASSSSAPTQAQPRQPARQIPIPAVGAVDSGYRFKGGNPSDPNAWERVQ